MRNLGQTRCRRCNRLHYGCINQGCIPDDQWQELLDYAREHGWTWKAHLCDSWLASETLRWARNIIGPSGLYKIDLNAQMYERKVRGKTIIGRPNNMPIEDWFDPHDVGHIRAWEYLNRRGVWPEGFIPEYVDMSAVWSVAIANKMARAWADHVLATDYVESTP